MTDETAMTDGELAAKGQRVSREWPEVKEALAILVSAKTKDWMRSDDRDERERLHAEVRALNDLLTDLQANMILGSAAKARLDAAR